MSDFPKSKSDAFLDDRFLSKPIISPLIAKSVSQHRKQSLASDVKKGIYRDGKSGGEEPELSDYATYSVGSKKVAQVLSSQTNTSSSGVSQVGGYKGSGDTFRQGPEVYSPLWLTSNLSLPRDRATVNAWSRAFFALNPVVQNAVSLHSTYPISKLNIKCHNKEVEKFFNEMIEELDLMNICVQIAQEYWLLGEAFVYAELDQSKGKWSRLVIQNPDYMVVKPTVMANEPTIMMRPDDHLRRIITSNKPTDIEQRKQLNSYIVDAVKRNQNIVLDNFNISFLSRKISPYEIRGTGLPVSVFRSLMLFDQLRESKFAQAANMINPLTVVKVGSAEYKPSPDVLEDMRNTFESAQYDKDFKIFTNNDVSIERIGYGQGIYDITNDVNQLMKEIYIGLMVPSVLMDGGADTTYANGGVALDVLRQRYMQFRNMMANWLRRKIFAPISQIQEFYEYVKVGSKTEKRLIVPEVDWNHMSLFDAGDYITNLVNLSQGEGDQKRVSLHTLYRSLGLDYEDEARKMRKEAIGSTIAKKEKAALETMNLNNLRALSDEDEILEPKEDEAPPSPVPGETPPPSEAPPELPGGIPTPPPAP